MPNNSYKHNEIRLLEELKQNKKQFRYLLEAVPDAVVIVNVAGDITFANKRITAMFGYSPQELIGQPMDILLQENVRSIHSQHQADFFANPEIRTMGKRNERFGCRKDGATFPIEIGLGYLTMDNEVEAVAFIVDITERKRIEEALKARNYQSLKQAQAIAHIGTWEVNLQTDEVIWSDEFFKICGLESGRVEPSVELSFSMVHPDDREQAIIAFNQLQECGDSYDIEKRIVRPDGEIRWVISQGEMIVDVESKVEKLVGTFIDITNRKLAQERDFDIAIERERMRLLTTFVQNVAHEFRTPLSVISSSAYLMSKSDDSERRLSKAETIQQQVSRTAQLVEMLLMMVKLESSVSVLQASVDINVIFNQVCEDLAHSYGDKPELCIEGQTNLPLVLGNWDYLYTAFQQLLDNAFRFTPINGEITVVWSQTDTDVWLELRDTGSGISDENLNHIFTTFWRQDTAHSTPGFGLGLTIAQKIIQIHGGTIDVESKVDEGSTFRVRLPIAPQPE